MLSDKKIKELKERLNKEKLGFPPRRSLYISDYTNAEVLELLAHIAMQKKELESGALLIEGKVRLIDSLQAQLTAANAENVRLREALEEIAKDRIPPYGVTMVLRREESNRKTAVALEALAPAGSGEGDSDE